MSMVSPDSRLYDAHAPTHYLLGYAYEKQKDLARAARSYGRAVYWQPDDSLSYNAWGRVLKMQGRVEEAIRVLRKGTDARPDNALMHANLGLLLAGVGKTQEARTEVLQAVELDPNSDQVRHVAERVLGRAVR